MESIQYRISLFLATGLITQEEASALREWVKIIDRHSENYDKEKLERMITHSAMMIKRQREGEEVGNMPDEVFAGLEEDGNYERSLKLYEQMNAVFPVSEQEKRYLILHLISLFVG